ncbi:MAG: hypothetical protein ACKVPX_10710 [Myxococcaceae bacterium]
MGQVSSGPCGVVARAVMLNGQRVSLEGLAPATQHWLERHQDVKAFKRAMTAENRRGPKAFLALQQLHKALLRGRVFDGIRGLEAPLLVALIGTGASDALSTLVPRLAALRAGEFRWVARALASSGCLTLERVFSAMLPLRTPKDAETAARLLYAYGAKGTPCLRTLLEDARPGVRAAAARAMRGDRANTKQLIAVSAKDPSPMVRGAAQSALWRLGADATRVAGQEGFAR